MWHGMWPQMCWSGFDKNVFDEDMFSAAAERGVLETLQWLRAQTAARGTGRRAQAAKSGHLDVLKRARANGCPWDEEDVEIRGEARRRRRRFVALERVP